MKTQNTQTAKPNRSAAQVRAGVLLACITELKPIREQLATLVAKYRGEGEDRIAWEMMAAIGALDNTIKLAELYSTADQRTEGSHQRMVSIQPGTRYTKDGISVDIDCVKDGDVYVRRWPKGVTTQSFFANCIRMPVAQFIEQVQGATMEANDQGSRTARLTQTMKIKTRILIAAACGAVFSAGYLAGTIHANRRTLSRAIEVIVGASGF